MKTLTTGEQRARARRVLDGAARLYRQKRGSLIVCLDLVPTPNMLDVEYARRVLRGVLWLSDLASWEAHPMRRRADVWRAINTAIRWCSRRAGGWAVRGQARSVVAHVPANRQHLEWVRGGRSTGGAL